jgi:ribosomal protein L29
MEKTTELRKLDTVKLKETLKTKNNELMEKKIMYTVGKSKDTSVFNKLKKEIARINTVLKEKEILNG